MWAAISFGQLRHAVAAIGESTSNAQQEALGTMVRVSRRIMAAAQSEGTGKVVSDILQPPFSR
jgi:hypothetical protein